MSQTAFPSITALAAWVLAALGAPAGAQEGGGPTAHEVLTEVVVTARRREESLQDTPISVTALRSADLEARGIDNLEDLNGAAPNVGWQASPAGGTSTANFFIRGVGQFDFISTADQSVGLYLDGVYLPRSIGAALDVVDVERIEILRGPQGTLFGRNTIGGAVQVVTRAPGNEFEGSVEATTGSRDRADVKAHVDVPLSDSVATSISVASLHQDGYGKRLVTGQDTGNINNNAVHGQLRWNLGADSKLLISADASRRRGHSSPEQLLSNDDSNPIQAMYNALVLAPQGFRQISAANFVSSRPNESWAGTPNHDDYDTRGASATFSWGNPGSLELKSITAWRSLKSATDYDFDGTPYPFLDQSVAVRQHQLSQELQLSGLTAASRLQWLMGAYYFRENVTEDQVGWIFAPIERTGSGPYDFQILGLGLGYTTYLNQITDSSALYGQASFRIVDRLSLTAGLRYTYEKKELTNANTGSVVRGPVSVSDNWDALTPKAGVEFKSDPRKLLYVSVSRGFRSGGFNGRETTNPKPDSYDPEYLLAYEAGFKSDLLDRALRLNLASYYYDYKDKQGVALKPNATITVGNIGKVALYGFEMETTAVPLHGLQLSLGVGYGHNRIESIDPSGRLTLRPDSQLENAPRWTGNASASYTRPLGAAGSLTLFSAARYKSSHWFMLPNNPGELQGSYAILDGRIMFTSRSSAWELQLFGLNLANRVYRVFAENTVGFGFPGVIGNYGRPREWGLSVKYNF